MNGQLDIYDCIEIAERGLDGRKPTKKLTKVCDQCGLDLMWPAEICGFCIEENRRSKLNEERADRGMAAVAAATRQPHTLMENPVVSAIEDTLGHLAHACDRFGLDAETMFRDGLRLYKRQLREGPKAQQLSEGDHLTISEVGNLCQVLGAPRASALS